MTEELPERVLPTEYLTAIGNITANGALMDQLVDCAIWLVMRMPPERGRAVTGLIVNTSRKITFLRDLITPMINDDNIGNDFHAVYCKLKSAQANRSRIVHAKWVVTEPSREIHIEVFESDETEPSAEPMPLKRLQRYGSELAQAHSALEQFFLRVDLVQEGEGETLWPPRHRPRKFRRKGQSRQPVDSP